MGEEQYNLFFTERLNSNGKSLNDTIKRNKFPLFNNRHTKAASNDKQQIASLKEDRSLFSKLYVSCQVRNGDIDEFFRHENQSSPPSLSQGGSLRHGEKSALMPLIEKLSPCHSSEKPCVDALLLDGAAVVNRLKPAGVRTFQDYANDIFLPFVKHHLQSVSRLDVVWDQYLPNSLKASTRRLRGKGIGRHVKPTTRIPANWESFLGCNENKRELFNFLADCVTANDMSNEGKYILSTKEDRVVCTPTTLDIKSISPSSQEEADTRLFLHAKDAVNAGHVNLMISTVDTDVVVLAIALFDTIQPSELWISFGTGDRFRYIAIHNIANALGPKCKALPAFHAISGCDTTSSFHQKGKKSAWDTWQLFDDVTEAFVKVWEVPSVDRIKELMPLFEQFIIFMYDKTSTCSSVDEARKDLFTRKGRSIDLIPPTSAALLQHVKRSAYQAGHVWGQALVSSPALPTPAEWGWSKISEEWHPLWSTLQQASVSCMEFMKCGCNPDKGCRGRCKCLKNQLVCTTLCKCGGDCERL